MCKSQILEFAQKVLPHENDLIYRNQQETKAICHMNLLDICIDFADKPADSTCPSMHDAFSA